MCVLCCAAWLITIPYIGAQVAGTVEYFLELWLFPPLKQAVTPFAVGVALVLAGDILRKTGIVTAKHNFTHRIATEHRSTHTLVTSGIYSYVVECRLSALLWCDVVWFVYGCKCVGVSVCECVRMLCARFSS